LYAYPTACVEALEKSVGKRNVFIFIMTFSQNWPG
jgi:hypothetical protein